MEQNYVQQKRICMTPERILSMHFFPAKKSKDITEFPVIPLTPKK